jgi:hypothetical protein
VRSGLTARTVATRNDWSPLHDALSSVRCRTYLIPMVRIPAVPVLLPIAADSVAAPRSAAQTSDLERRRTTVAEDRLRRGQNLGDGPPPPGQELRAATSFFVESMP